MKLIFDIITESLTGLIITILSPIVYVFRKNVINFLKRYLEKWYANFLISVAKKEKYKDIATISYLSLIIICIFIFSTFSKYEDDFGKIESEFHAYKLLNDSLYLRIEKNKIRTGDYNSEVTDIQKNETSKYEPKDSLNLYTKTLSDKKELDKLSNLVIQTKVLFKIGSVAIWGFVIYVTYLFTMMTERIRMINDYEWGLCRKRNELTNDDILNLETEWANLKTSEEYKGIMNRLK